MKVVACGIVFIGIEIRENVGYVDKLTESVYTAAVMQTAVGNSTLLEIIVDPELIGTRTDRIRSTAYAVQRLYLAELVLKINADSIHICISLHIIYNTHKR